MHDPFKEKINKLSKVINEEATDTNASIVPQTNNLNDEISLMTWQNCLFLKSGCLLFNNYYDKLHSTSYFKKIKL